MKKKLISMILVGLSLTLVGCGDKSTLTEDKVNISADKEVSEDGNYVVVVELCEGVKSVDYTLTENGQLVSSKEDVDEGLKENIMSLELKPGELLSEVELSEKLNISRTPIREVLMRLKNEHLIEVKPQSGTYVSLIDLDLIEEAIFMRFALEEKVLKEACNYFPEDKIIELEKEIMERDFMEGFMENDV